MELWTYEHAITLLPALAAMLVIGLVLRLTIGGKPLKIRMIPFQVLACILLALEVGKQVTSIIDGYDLYRLPFHFCSLFIFMLPIMSFYKGKHRETVTAITTAICAALFALMLIYPNLIYGAGNIRDYFDGFIDFHTVTFHNIVMLEFVLIVALRLHEPDKKRDIKSAIIFTLYFCAVSATMAQILKTNYANFHSCNIPVFEEIRLSMADVIGAVPVQIIYILILTVLNVLFVVGSYMLYTFLYRLTERLFKTGGKTRAE